MGFIKIIKYEYEPEWFVGFTFSNSTLESYQEIYLNDNELSSLAKELVGFPQKNNQINFEQGSNNTRSAYYLKISIFIYNSSGHTTINITLNNNRQSHLSEQSHFNILCTPSDINNFGNKLSRWCSNPNDELIIEFKSDISRI